MTPENIRRKFVYILLYIFWDSPDILEVEAPSQAWEDSNNLACNKKKEKPFIRKQENIYHSYL